MNNERRLQISNHLVVDLNSLGDKFVSAYSLDGVHILPPLMTDIKRIEMQQLRLQALAIEMALKRNKPAMSLMPRMVNASTNTAMAENSNSNTNINPNPNTNTNLNPNPIPNSNHNPQPNPRTNPQPNPKPNPKPNPNTVPDPVPDPTSASSTLVVLGRIRQQLQMSQTAIFDHSPKEPETVAPTPTLPLLTASHEVIKYAANRAVILPVEMGSLRYSLVPKLNSNAELQRSTDTIDLRVRTGEDHAPEQPVVFSSSTLIQVGSSKSAEGIFRSRIPVRRQRANVLTTIQPQEVNLIACGQGSGQERNGQKTNSANDRRRNYGAKVALKRNEIARKREELAKLKPPTKTTNHQVPKSIRTPIRRMEGGQSPLEQQRFQSQEPLKIDNQNNQLPKSIRTPIRRVEVGESPIDQPRFKVQEASPPTSNNNQVPKSIRTPIRRVNLEMDQQKIPFQSLDQEPESSKTNSSQASKSIRTPIRRVEGGESPLEQQHLQIQNSPKTNNENQVPKSIRTPIRQLEEGFEEPVVEQKGNTYQLFDQQPVSSQTLNNNNQVVKSIRTPIRRVLAGTEESALLNQLDLLRSLASCQEAEQQRLQAQMEQEQQGLIDQLVGQMGHNDSQDIASEVVVGQ